MFPTEIRFKTNTLLKVMLSPPGAFFLGGVTVLIFRNWPSDNAAAWVQAVGSIGAILGAFMIATHAHKLERAGPWTCGGGAAEQRARLQAPVQARPGDSSAF